VGKITEVASGPGNSSSTKIVTSTFIQAIICAILWRIHSLLQYPQAVLP